MCLSLCILASLASDLTWLPMSLGRQLWSLRAAWMVAALTMAAVTMAPSIPVSQETACTSETCNFL